MTSAIEPIMNALREASVGDVSQLGEGVLVRPGGGIEAARAVEMAQKISCKLRVRGEGDMLHAPAPGALVMDLSRLERVLAIDKQSAVARVEAGCQVSALENQARRAGLTVGELLPSTLRGSVGAWLAGPTRGARAVPPGRLETAALAVEIVLPDGTRAQSRAAPRSAMGPDLDQLVVGGQGRIAVLLAAAVRLLPVGEIADSVHAFADRTAALSALAGLCRLPLPPARVRVECAANGVTVALRYGGPRAWRESAHASDWLHKLGAMPLGNAETTQAQARLAAPVPSTIDMEADWSALPALLDHGAGEADLVALHVDGAFVSLSTTESVDSIGSVAAAAGARILWPTRLAPTDFWKRWGVEGSAAFDALQLLLDPAGTLR